jgi:hypothetical protein
MSLTSYRAAPPRAKEMRVIVLSSCRRRTYFGAGEMPAKTNGGLHESESRRLRYNDKEDLPFAGLATTYSPRS